MEQELNKFIQKILKISKNERNEESVILETIKEINKESSSNKDIGNIAFILSTLICDYANNDRIDDMIMLTEFSKAFSDAAKILVVAHVLRDKKESDDSDYEEE